MRGISGQAYAILIGSSRYPDEPKLEDLKCPENDVDGLNDVLTSKVHGLFTQTCVLKNRPHYAVMQKIVEVLRKAAKEDFVLIYYSGHGKLNRVGNLHLATVNTMLDTLEATSIPVQSIRDFIDVSSSTKIALILDCCFSGAAGEILSKGSVEDQLQKVSQGRGKYIITASTGVQVAQEKESDQYGMLTKHIIEGIKGGKADYDEDGLISVDELYRYVHDHVLEEASQEPTKWDLNVRGELYIARTGKTPKQERRRQIRGMLHDRARRGMLPSEIVLEALKVLGADPAQRLGKFQSYYDLLNRFFEKQLTLGEFVELWYKVKREPVETEAPEPASGEERTQPEAPGLSRAIENVAGAAQPEISASAKDVAKARQTEISGSVRDARDRTALPNAKITLLIGSKELAVLFSDAEGRFEHQEAASYAGQILTCQVDKEQYQSKTATHRIEQEEIWLEIQLVPVPVEKIEFTLAVKDEQGNPLQGVALTLEVDANQVGAGVSDKDGFFKISLTRDLEGKTLHYGAELKGFELAEGEVELQEATSCAIAMKKIPALRPHRGRIVLALGILGLLLASLILLILPLIPGLICAIMAWKMGKNDLRQMDAGTMDPSGRGLTKAGKIIGIIAAIAQIALVVFWTIMIASGF